MMERCSYCPECGALIACSDDHMTDCCFYRRRPMETAGSVKASIVAVLIIGAAFVVVALLGIFG